MQLTKNIAIDTNYCNQHNGNNSNVHCANNNFNDTTADTNCNAISSRKHTSLDGSIDGAINQFSLQWEQC